MQRQHVSAPDEEIEKLIADRAQTWPAAARRSAQKFALYCHRKNQGLVRDLRL